MSTNFGVTIFDNRAIFYTKLEYAEGEASLVGNEVYISALRSNLGLYYGSDPGEDELDRVFEFKSPVYKLEVVGMRHRSAHEGSQDELNSIVLCTPSERKEQMLANGGRAFRWAAREGNIEGLLALLFAAEATDTITHNDNEAFRWAARNGHLPIVKVLLRVPKVLKMVTANNNEAFRWAARNGHSGVVSWLMQVPAIREKIGVSRNIALREAALNGHHRLAHFIASAQWPGGKVDMPVYLKEDAAVMGAIAAGAKEYRELMVTASDIEKKYGCLAAEIMSYLGGGITEIAGEQVSAFTDQAQTSLIQLRSARGYQPYPHTHEDINDASVPTTSYAPKNKPK